MEMDTLQPTLLFNADTPKNLEDQFYAIIDRLKAQKVLPQDSFVKELPFFNLSSISKESQLKELFQDANDPNIYKTLVRNINNLNDESNPELFAKRLSAMQVMGFAQIILYKVLPCCDKDCPNAPREVAPRNQYKDYEYSCPFYHHDKDQRRLVITPKIEDEFTYKANYLIESKITCNEEREKHSLNYFESLYHPLYYKLFRCKREYCNFSHFCPFFHSDEERKTWDNMFSNFIRKDRVSYVKDKQKYYQNQTKSHLQKFASSSNSPNNSRNYQHQNSGYGSWKQRNENDRDNCYRQQTKRNSWKNDTRKNESCPVENDHKERNSKNKPKNSLSENSSPENNKFNPKRFFSNRGC